MKRKLNIIYLSVILSFITVSSFAQTSSKVIVYRKGCIYGSLAKYKVIIDGKEIGVLKGSSTYAYDLAPGAHTVSPKQKNRSVTLNTEAGKTYVIKYRTMLGLFGARPRLKEVTLEEAKKDSKVVRKQYS